VPSPLFNHSIGGPSSIVIVETEPGPQKRLSLGWSVNYSKVKTKAIPRGAAIWPRTSASRHTPVSCFSAGCNQPEDLPSIGRI